MLTRGAHVFHVSRTYRSRRINTHRVVGEGEGEGESTRCVLLAFAYICAWQVFSLSSSWRIKYPEISHGGIKKILQVFEKATKNFFSSLFQVLIPNFENSREWTMILVIRENGEDKISIFTSVTKVILMVWKIYEKNSTARNTDQNEFLTKNRVSNSIKIRIRLFLKESRLHSEAQTFGAQALDILAQMCILIGLL